MIRVGVRVRVRVTRPQWVLPAPWGGPNQPITSSVLLQALIRDRVRVRVRVTELVYQIGFITPF